MNLSTDAEAIKTLHDENQLPLTAVKDPEGSIFQANEGVVMVDQRNHSHTLLARHQGQQQHTKTAAMANRPFGNHQGEKPRTELRAGFTDPNVALVTLVGKAGTGKTLLALAAGLHQVADTHHYARLLNAAANLLGRDIGYLLKLSEEKTWPWMKPIIDNIDFHYRFISWSGC